ncbi:DNA repair protein RadC [Hydrobacter penzbergensis]|uniref:DNA repair protein RadC n=1 Tax=Hydrobacter penzbergensis TaxID=1235997 RepID=A0A8X8IDT5_9BACT|nr:DNA repair protein RadC [Hydrobacter penzbergensis]
MLHILGMGNPFKVCNGIILLVTINMVYFEFTSSQDTSMTERIKEAGNLLNIQVLDHLILSPIKGEYFSFKEEGVL